MANISCGLVTMVTRCTHTGDTGDTTVVWDSEKVNTMLCHDMILSMMQVLETGQ